LEQNNVSNSHDVKISSSLGNVLIPFFYYIWLSISVSYANIINAAGSQSADDSYSTCNEEIDTHKGGCSVGVPQGREAWSSYNIDEIDPSIIDELPPEIQEEFRTWLRPQKRPNVAKRGSSITHYFLPDKSR